MLEIVPSYTYLGVIFNYNGKFNVAKKALYDRASKAMFSVIGHCRKLQLPTTIAMDLFDKMVLPILTYGCEAWGHGNLELLEKLHLRFCKIILGVSKITASCMVYGELGRFPVDVYIKTKMLSYWAKLISGKPDKWSTRLYRVVVGLHNDGYIISEWCSVIQNTLNETGNSELWINQRPVNNEWLKLSIAQTLKDQFRQKWYAEVMVHPKCINYRCLITDHSFKPYLDMDIDESTRNSLSRFRLGSSPLPAAIGRNRGLDQDEQCCNECNLNAVGDEFHFILECPSFNTRRRSILPPNWLTYPNVLKFKMAMNPGNPYCTTQLGKFCEFIMKKLKG